MIELQGRSFDCCDRISRRNALKIGFLGLGSLSLPELLRARALAGTAESHAQRHRSSLLN